MKERLYNSLSTFLCGLLAAAGLFLLSYVVFDLAHIPKPFPATPIGVFLHLLIIVALIEEGAKFLLIRRGIGKYPYGYLLGFGFGISEALLTYPISEVWRGTGSTLLHIVTVGIIAYFIMKKRPTLGLMIAIAIHLGYNYLVL